MAMNTFRTAHHRGRSEQERPRTQGLMAKPGTAAATRANTGANPETKCKQVQGNCSNWAATATAITSGCLPVIPGRPMGQVTCASSASV